MSLMLSLTVTHEFLLLSFKIGTVTLYVALCFSYRSIILPHLFCHFVTKKHKHNSTH